MHHGLLLRPCQNLTLTSFSNAYWACCLDDRCSIATYCVYLGDSLVFWYFIKQNVVARSSNESEY